MTGQLMAMTGRNFKIYIRDRGAVFFSLLSMFIVIGLMLIFLGDNNIDAVTDLLGQFPGRDAAVDEKNVKLLILTWTCAGIISINAVTVTLSVFSSMIKDKATGRIHAIYTAPVSQFITALGYVLAAWAASVLICIFTLAITELYGVISGLEWFSLKVHVQLVGMIMINSFAYAAFMYVLAVFVKSEGAWSGLGTIVGTLVGFLGGIYLPIGELSNSIGNLMKCTPILYGAAMFRDVMTKNILQDTFDGTPAELVREYREVMGIDLVVGGRQASVHEEMILLLIFGLVFLIIGMFIVKREKRRDR